MNKPISVSLVLFFLLSLVLFLVLTRNSNPTELEKNYLTLPVEQTKKDRIWREIRFTERGSFNGIVNPISMKPGTDGMFYVGDVNDLYVKAFDHQANLTDTLGLGKGRGPGEFLDLYVIILDEEKQKIWINDRDNGRITVLDIEDEKWEIINPNIISAAAIPVDSGNYVVDQFIYGELVKFSSTQRQITKFEPFLKDPKPWIIVLQGNYAIAQDYSILKSFIYTNNFIRYSKNGEILYFRKPIEPPEFAAITNSPEQNDIGVQENLYDFRSAEQFTSGINVVGSHIHLLISRNMEHNKKDTGPGILTVKRDFVDVYEVETGDYLYTYRLPETVSILSVSKKYIAAVSTGSGKLKVWEVESVW